MSEPMEDEAKHWLEQAAYYEQRLTEAEIANREKDAEIERLKLEYEEYRNLGVDEWNLREQLHQKELASLRASVGEKWIECKQELPPMEEDRGFGPCSRRVLINQPVYAILNRPEGCDMWWMDDEENEVHPLEWKPDSPTKDKE